MFQTFEANISQHCWTQHAAHNWPPCCNMLQHVAYCCPDYHNLKPLTLTILLVNVGIVRPGLQEKCITIT